MHLRIRPWAAPELAACPFYIEDAPPHRGRWRELFNNDRPLWVDLGCGKGVGTAATALNEPGINLLGVDVVKNVLAYARRNAVEAFKGKDPENLFLVKANVDLIEQVFAPEDRVDVILINFPCPWDDRPKRAKHRFTYPKQLMKFREFLREDGEIRLKTDDEALFRASVAYFAQCGFRNVLVTPDLHASGYSSGYESEHERMFVSEGKKILYGVWRRIG